MFRGAEAPPFTKINELLVSTTRHRVRCKWVMHRMNRRNRRKVQQLIAASVKGQAVRTVVCLFHGMHANFLEASSRVTAALDRRLGKYWRYGRSVTLCKERGIDAKRRARAAECCCTCFWWTLQSLNLNKTGYEHAPSYSCWTFFLFHGYVCTLISVVGTRWWVIYRVYLVHWRKIFLGWKKWLVLKEEYHNYVADLNTIFRVLILIVSIAIFYLARIWMYKKWGNALIHSFGRGNF